jgi:transposase
VTGPVDKPFRGMKPPSLAPDLFAHLPPEVQAYIRHLEGRLAALEARLNQDSSNSSRPPSTDPPHAKPAPPRPASGRRRGGQPGHPRHARPDLPPDAVIELRAETCRACCHPLAGDDPAPVRHQVLELPPIRPHVTEYRRHRLACLRCGRVTCPDLPLGVRSGYGPRLQAACGLLAGSYRLSKRAVAAVCREVLGVPIGPGAVCRLERSTADALATVAAEARRHVAGRPANVDETGWRQGRGRAWLWVAVTQWVTAFVVRPSRGRPVLTDLIDGPPGVLTTDRYPAYDHLPAEARQVCWAHLRRDFQAMIDRADAGTAIGEDLLTYADILLGHWQRVRDGTLTRVGFRRHVGWLRPAVADLLTCGAGCGCAATAGTCRELLRVEASLWTFAWTGGVEPTNNAAERALRHAVCWRETSYGTDSPAGSRFVERVLTVVATCRQQGRDVLAFLTDAVLAARVGAQPPSLLPANG